MTSLSSITRPRPCVASTPPNNLHGTPSLYPRIRPLRKLIPVRPILSPLSASQSDSVPTYYDKLNNLSLTSRKTWTLMREVLKATNVKFLSPQEAIFARERGAVLLDVRTAGEYEKGHIPGAANVPFYQPITGWTPFKVARRLGFAVFGVFNGTEFNPDFLTEMRDVLPEPDTEVIVYCAYGGSIESSDNSKHGNQTRATIAAYILVEEGGYTNVSVLKGGFTEWQNGGRDVEALVYE